MVDHIWSILNEGYAGVKKLLIIYFYYSKMISEKFNDDSYKK